MANFPDKELFEAEYAAVSEGVRNALKTLDAAYVAAGEAADDAREEAIEQIISAEPHCTALKEASSRARAEALAPFLHLEHDLRGKLQAARKLQKRLERIEGWGDDCPVGHFYVNVENLVESLASHVREEVSSEAA